LTFLSFRPLPFKYIRDEGLGCYQPTLALIPAGKGWSPRKVGSGRKATGKIVTETLASPPRRNAMEGSCLQQLFQFRTGWRFRASLHRPFVWRAKLGLGARRRGNLVQKTLVVIVRLRLRRHFKLWHRCCATPMKRNQTSLHRTNTTGQGVFDDLAWVWCREAVWFGMAGPIPMTDRRRC